MVRNALANSLNDEQFYDVKDLADKVIQKYYSSQNMINMAIITIEEGQAKEVPLADNLLYPNINSCLSLTAVFSG